jgi:MazG family protein
MTDRLGSFQRLVDVMARLRAPDGCPWDRKQDLQTLKAYVLEEAYELIDALDSRDPDKIREESGDLLFQVVFIAEIAREQGWFDVHDAAAGIADKLVRRHPWVFGDLKVSDPEAALRQWEILKARERAAKPDGSVLDGIPRELPALLQALRLGGKAAQVGFDWPDLAGVLAKVEEEVREFRLAAERGEAEEMRREMGDILFAICQTARKLGIDPEDALRATNRKFIERFRHVERRLRESGRVPDEAGAEELDRLWNEAKRGNGSGQAPDR